MSARSGGLLRPSTTWALRATCVGGAAAYAVGLAVAPARAMSSALASGFLFVSIAVGAVAFLALMAVSNASWHVVLKRVPEALALALPAGAVALVVLLPSLPSLYPWAAAAAAEDPLLAGRHAWLNGPFFSARMLGALALWWAFALALRRGSMSQDDDGDVRHTRRAVGLSAVFLVLFALTFSMASFDWLMTTEAHWASTIYALYNLAGALVAGTAAITVVTILLRRAGVIAGVAESHLHDLGKLLFGFCCLWAYLWISQYLLIWYANLPEETAHYLSRQEGGWGALFWMNVLLGWGMPFVLLLSRRGKRSESNLIWACGFLLTGRWLDTYLLVAPGGSPEHQGIGLIELGVFAGVGCAFVLAVARALTRAPARPLRDPYLSESLHHHA